MTFFKPELTSILNTVGSGMFLLLYLVVLFTEIENNMAGKVACVVGTIVALALCMVATFHNKPCSDECGTDCSGEKCNAGSRMLINTFGALLATLALMVMIFKNYETGGVSDKIVFLLFGLLAMVPLFIVSFNVMGMSCKCPGT